MDYFTNHRAPLPQSHICNSERKQTARLAESERVHERERDCGRAGVSSWELANHIAVKLNGMLKGLLCYRNGAVVPYPELDPSDVLRKASGRDELEFYYRRMCVKDEYTA